MAGGDGRNVVSWHMMTQTLPGPVQWIRTTTKMPKSSLPDIERIVEFDFVRATEAAALNVFKWIGKGDKNAADAAACDTIRGMFDLMDISGSVVIGEGIKDEAPGIFTGEH